MVCGRNEPLRERLLAAGVRHAFGWVEDMPSLMHAADVLVQNAGGITVLEAVASGLPVVTYRSIPGHGLTNAAALDEAGVARWVRHPNELAAALAGAVRPDPAAAALVTTAPAASSSTGPGATAQSDAAQAAPLLLPAKDPVRLLLEGAGLGHLAAAVPAQAPAVAAASIPAQVTPAPAPAVMESVR
ncbi:glycosyltransferase [Streptacidiphilus sp. PAMC 29251]